MVIITITTDAYFHIKTARFQRNLDFFIYSQMDT